MKFVMKIHFERWKIIRMQMSVEKIFSDSICNENSTQIWLKWKNHEDEEK